MSADRVSYIDSSALVKLAAPEPESRRLSQYVGRRALVSSALARTEVERALTTYGAAIRRQGREVLAGVELVRINDRILAAAGTLEPSELRTLDAIHLATAQLFASMLAVVITYDDRMAAAAKTMGIRTIAPGA